MISLVWLIPVLPALAALVTSFLKAKHGRLASFISIAAMGLSTLMSFGCLSEFLGAAHAHHGHEAVRFTQNFTWLAVGSTPIVFGFVVDALTVMMLLIVTIVSLLVLIFSQGYMHDDENYGKFFCFLSLFSAAMLGLVIANNLLLMFMCWELVGLCSYLLIGFWYFKPSAAAACKKAFIVTRIGDIGLFLGLLLLYSSTGTLVFYGSPAAPGILDEPTLAKLGSGVVHLPFAAIGLSTLAALLLFCGSMGKSAQFPLHVWLPDAMEGPTPVSALIHAATMVAAGVFLVGRAYPIFELGAGHGHTSQALGIVSTIGAITALFAATIAVAQNDIKRVLAYSTVSQLGYMMMGLGVGGYVAGLFHLTTHAFFKALLFLGSGSVIHGCHGEQDMTKMGGLRKAMPVTFATYLIGTLALAGIFPFAGFFSKDEILLDAFHTNRWIYRVGLTGAFLTAFYMTRQIVMVFLGRQRSHDFHAHESGPSMLLPLLILAFLSITAGFAGAPFLGNPFHHFLAPDRHANPASLAIMLISSGVAVAGIVAGFLVYGRSEAVARGEDPLAQWLKGAFTVLQRKYYMDELYERTVVALTAWLGRLGRAFDERVIDGALDFIGSATLAGSRFNHWCDNFFINKGFDRACDGVRGSGFFLSRLQRGTVQTYLRALASGAFVLYTLYLYLLGFRG